MRRSDVANQPTSGASLSSGDKALRFCSRMPHKPAGATPVGAAPAGMDGRQAAAGTGKKRRDAPPAGRWFPCMTFTMVTAAGMSTGDRIIRKIMNGINMALPSFLCEGSVGCVVTLADSRSFSCPTTLRCVRDENVARSMRRSDVVNQPTSGASLSSGDKAGIRSGQSLLDLEGQAEFGDLPGPRE